MRCASQLCSSSTARVRHRQPPAKMTLNSWSRRNAVLAVVCMIDLSLRLRATIRSNMKRL
eukprot:3194105-Pyramimonas_sp.AAC.1